MCICGSNFFALVWPARLEYLSPLAATGLFLLLATPVVLLGLHSLAGLGKTRQRVAIGLRLLVTLVLVLILAGLRWQRTSHDLEVMVLRDISQSTAEATDFPGKSLSASLDEYLTAAANPKDKPADDKVGQISFQQDARIDALPNTHLTLGTGSIRDAGTNTDIAAAVNLGLATMGKDAMHRLVLVSDGNPTMGDLDAAVSAARAAHVPIDVVPLHYDVQHEVLMDRFVAPTWKRENEPFTLYVYLKSTDDQPVTGRLTILHQGVPMDLDPSKPGVQSAMAVTLPPGTPEHPSVTPVPVKVPPLLAAGVHQFKANFEPDRAGAQVSVESGQSGTGVAKGNGVDTLTSNNSGEAFTYVQGKGRILYVDNVPDGGGDLLARALNSQGVAIQDADHVTPQSFPTSLIDLQNYDAVVLANVPFGPGGLSDQQQQNLAQYVHDLGGGLAMVGGPDAFGAGGWQGKKLEEVLPVDMDIPATRQIPKGALVLLMHSCEFPQGNYFGEQCAIKAIETLSARDEVGIVSYSWNGGGSQFDFPLGDVGDGSKPKAAAKNMQVGDMPSFDDAMTATLHGRGGSRGLIDSDAAQKHVIIISDGDPAPPAPALVAEYQKAKVSVSTITVYPHGGNVIEPTLQNIAKQLKGKAYGPINDNFSQLPQIFVKEATVVRRSLISESSDGIPLYRRPTGSDVMRGVGDPLPRVLGLVLTTKKNNPQVQMPITAGMNNDPLLATWQTGLGRAAVYTSDATNKWGVRWVARPDYEKFWAQLVRSVARPPMSNQFDVNVTSRGDRGHVVVEGVDKDSGFADFLNIDGPVIGPTGAKTDLHLIQTGPGRYEADFPMPEQGTYVAVMRYRGANGEAGVLPVGGIAQNTSPELRDLRSNDALLKDIAERTGGRVLPAFDAAGADLFSRQSLGSAVSSLPVWDRLIPVLLLLILLDVATRRIAWDAAALKQYAGTVTGYVRSFTTVRRVETRSTLDALQRVRQEGTTTTPGTPAPPPRPDPKAKFTGKAVQGDIANVVGGATDKPVPKAPANPQPKGTAPGEAGGMGSLMEAKRRAQAKIREKEQGE